MNLSFLSSEVFFLFLENPPHLWLHLLVGEELSLAEVLVDGLGDLADHELDLGRFVDQELVVLDQLGQVLRLVPGALEVLRQEVRGLQDDDVDLFRLVALVVGRRIHGERGLGQALRLLLAGGVGALEDARDVEHGCVELVPGVWRRRVCLSLLD